KMDGLVFVGTAPSNATTQDVCLQYQNSSGLVHSFGAEAEVRWQAGPGTLFSAWYAYRFVRDDTGVALFQGVPLPNSPEHTAGLKAMYPLVSQALLVSTE